MSEAHSLIIIHSFIFIIWVRRIFQILEKRRTFGEELGFALTCTLVFGILSLTSDLACLGFCSLGYSAETKSFVLVELLLRKMLLGFSRVWVFLG